MGGIIDAQLANAALQSKAMISPSPILRSAA